MHRPIYFLYGASLVVLAIYLYLINANSWFIFIAFILSFGSFGIAFEKKKINKTDIKFIKCPKCKVREKMFNLVNRKNINLFIYNEGNPRIREADGLHIYPMICFKCSKVIEFAADPLKQSKNSTENIEYFKPKEISQKNKKEALKYAKLVKNEYLITKIKNLIKN